jgi:hypothetical protein
MASGEHRLRRTRRSLWPWRWRRQSQSPENPPSADRDAPTEQFFLDAPTEPLPGLGPPPPEGAFRIGGHVRHTADTRRLPRIPPADKD